MALGGSIYLLFRPTSLVLFSWIERIDLMDWVNALRNSVTFTLPDWVLYSLPDGLWIYSYILVIVAIRNFNIRESTLAIFCLPTVAIISEFLQLPGIIPGTFDPSDILAYTLGMALGIIHIIKTNQYEKKLRFKVQ